MDRRLPCHAARRRIASLLASLVVLTAAARGFGQSDEPGEMFVPPVGKAAASAGAAPTAPFSIALAPPSTAAPGVTKEWIEGELARLQQTDAALDPDMQAADARGKAIERYKSALRELGKIEDANASAVRYQAEAAAAAANAAELRAKTAAVARAAPDVAFEGRAPAELDAARATSEANLATLKQKLKDSDAVRAARTDRKAELRKTQAEGDAKLAELRRQLAAPAPDGESPALTAAKRAEAEAKLRAFEQSLPAVNFELAKYDAEDAVDLPRLRDELTRAEVAREEAALKRLGEGISRQRRSEAERQISQAQFEEDIAHPLLKPIAEENRVDAEEIRRLATKIEGVERSREKFKEEMERQGGRFRDIRDKVGQVGLTRPIGLMLREQRADLPNLREIEQVGRARQDLIEQSRLVMWRYEDRRKEVPSAVEYVNAAAKDVELSLVERNDLQLDAEKLLAAKRETLVELERLSKQYFDSLVDLDTRTQAYVDQSDDYLNYINERILWIRSAETLSPALVRGDQEMPKWLLSPANWKALAEAAAKDPFENPLAFWPTLIAVAALFYVRLRIRPRLRALGQHAAKRGFLRYGPTGQAAALTVISAATGPAVFLFLSWRLAEATEPTGFVQAAADALEICAALLFPIELLREVCRTSGLAEAHFEWPEHAVRPLRRSLTVVKTAGLPLTLFAVLAHARTPLAGGSPMERLLFIGGMGLAGGVLHTLLSGKSELSRALAAAEPDGVFTRFQPLWHAIGVVLPAALAVLSAVGYHYSATQLAGRLLGTLWLAAGLVLVRALAQRWVVLSRRRLLLDQAYKRRAAEEASDAESATPPTRQGPDVAGATVQTRKLIEVVLVGFAACGLWLVWADVLPAFNLLDRPVWSVGADGVPAAAVAAPAAGIDGALMPAATTAATDGGSSEVQVTCGDLAIGILIALFTFLASKNLPGLMEMSILNRLPVDNATRYAATRLASYAIIFVGVLMASNRIGLRWQNVQWMAAALTVGLGFGLQEVFANFVSGLIILFERPIRVGDIVTIDETTGVVSKIRMRATTITNWDRKEFIVPNKEFITGRLLNWTLSDAVNRLTVNVGVAYGTDTEQARAILLRICDENANLLKDPPPVAVFEGFGDSTLNLALRCFLPSLDHRLETINDLHTRIDQEFRKARIEIAFPQRDLHVRSVAATLPFATAAHSPDRSGEHRVAG